MTSAQVAAAHAQSGRSNTDFSKAEAGCQDERGDARIRACTTMLGDPTLNVQVRSIIFGLRGSAYASKGEHERAIGDFDKAIQLAPGEARFYSMRGQSNIHLGRYDQAIGDFNLSIKLAPDFEAYYHRGMAYSLLYQKDLAIADLSQAIRLKSDVPDSYSVRGSVYADIGQYDKARADYRKALSFPAKTRQQMESQKDLRSRLAALDAKKAEEVGSSGTGILVSANGKVLTNEHVIRRCVEIGVNFVGSEIMAGKVFAQDKTNDLALLQTEMITQTMATFRASARLGEGVFVYGFPLTGFLATSGNFTAGNITALAGVRDDTRLLQISAPVQAGNSGGPLLDGSGIVVGIVVAKLDALNFAAISKDLPQNVNFAIKSSIAINFLEANGVTPRGGANARLLAPPDIAERAGTFTVQIKCKYGPPG